MQYYTIKNKEGKYLHLERRGQVSWQDKINVSQVTFLRKEIEERKIILEKNGHKDLEIEELEIYARD